MQPTRASDPTPRRRRLAFALLPLVVLLSVTEIASRSLCSRRFEPFHTSVSIQGDTRWRADPTTLWTNRPFYLEYDGSTQYNELGLRVPPGDVRLPPKEPNELRVLCLGGSVMAGVGSRQDGEWLKMTGVSTHPIEDSIDGLLEDILQEMLPEIPVRVFNGAVASFAVEQSRLRYQSLRDVVDPDWVVSLDGVNEPRPLMTGELPWHRLEERWRRHPVNYPRFRGARLLMRNSAAFFLLGEQLFYRSGILRTPRSSTQDHEAVQRWLEARATVQVPATGPEPGILRAAAAFSDEIGRFHRQLEADGKGHVLLVQPHLSLRDPTRLGDTERALYNYYLHGSEGRSDAFMREIHRRVRVEFSGDREIVSLSAMHQDPGWVFLDYCHLTRTANLYVAKLLATRILADRREMPAIR